ncbi:MAG TPA: T9SS type A sorting domain-containing protein [Chitinophagaceae bacterium]|nr:T9SS type A sorting domain-containing protein [Chitinophagaceae bacterium]
MHPYLPKLYITIYQLLYIAIYRLQDALSVSGNSSNQLVYNFTDIDFSSVINYYRLKQINKEGEFSYSNIVLLKDNQIPAHEIFIIYPNPGKNILAVKTSSTISDKITLMVFEVSGKLLIKHVGNIANGESIISLDISHLPAGKYLLKLCFDIGKQSAIKKFVKQ